MTSIWGIVNVTPDSFSDGGAHYAADDAIAHGRLLREGGATVLDVGGESTRPGAEPVGDEIEIARILPVIRTLAADRATVSVDTYRAATAEAAIDAGAAIVNDVSGGLADPAILDVVAERGVDIALGHWRGPSSDMYAQATYTHIGREVADELSARAEAAIAAGVARERVILDPGIGFAKRGEQNWALLRELDAIVGLGYRVLVGTSRKGFLASALGEETTLERRDLATAVTSVLAVQAGAWGVRVHDAAATRDALAVAREWKG
ncbi:dihydropteroate synthase [Microbacterium sp. JZ101]